MRQVVLDTETTGLSAERGHRIIEIGCIELVERRRTGRTLHFYVNPERDIDDGALQVHGITAEFLQDKPRFAEVANDVLAFIDGAELIIHNAAFDVSFLDAEFARVDPRGPRTGERASVLDTLSFARERYPGQKNSLDALCKRLGVDNAHRELHGALLDAALLADVYLAMTAGQATLELSLDAAAEREHVRVQRRDFAVGALRIVYASADELAAHDARLDAIEKVTRRPALWREFNPPPLSVESRIETLVAG
jgi:DNA polymerase III subunit epsilon